MHKNSGVFNFWFYLLSVGGTGTNDFGTTYNVSGITIQKAARIAYRAEQFYFPPSATFQVARTATLQAAADLYGFGSVEMRAVAQAWRAVGLGEAAPVVGGLNPTSGPVGQVVVITGTNLSAVFGVSFNGTPATAGTLLSATQLQVVVPAGATTGPVVVTTPGGAGSSVGVFTVTSVGPAPTISGYTPAGGQRTGQQVVVTGTNLGGTTAVSIGGVAAVFVVNSATQLTVTVPATATSGQLAVTTPGGTVGVAFTVLPYLASFAPASGVIGTSVALTGTSFTGALSVKFNGVYAAFTVGSGHQHHHHGAGGGHHRGHYGPHGCGHGHQPDQLCRHAFAGRDELYAAEWHPKRYRRDGVRGRGLRGLRRCASTGCRLRPSTW